MPQAAEDRPQIAILASSNRSQITDYSACPKQGRRLLSIYLSTYFFIFFYIFIYFVFGLTLCNGLALIYFVFALTLCNGTALIKSHVTDCAQNTNYLYDGKEKYTLTSSL